MRAQIRMVYIAVDRLLQIGRPHQGVCGDPFSSPAVTLNQRSDP